MKALIDIKFNDIQLSLTNHNKSDFIHGFIFEELHHERQLLSLREYSNDIDFKFEHEMESANFLVTKIIIDIPVSLYDNQDHQKILHYIHSNLDIKHVVFLDEWFSNQTQYVLIAMDENNPNLNFDYRELDL